jgi:aminoglycoside phosphotransferase (APT) family kinase protein
VADDERTRLAELLGAALEGELGGPVLVESLERLTGGASRETWSFDATDHRGRVHPLILRRDFPGGVTQNPDVLAGRSDALDRAGEFALLEALYRANVPVPRPVVLPRGQPGLEECFVMERVEGESRPRKIIRSDEYAGVRAGLSARLGTILASIHALGPDDLPALPRRPVDLKLEMARALLDRSARPRPVLELALRWCRERMPRAREVRLVHGDFRTSNYVVGPEGVRAVFDWEFSHLGDPVADLGYLCMRAWRFGEDALEVSGVGVREDLYDAYQAAGGSPVDPDDVHYWEALNGLYAAIVFLMRGLQHAEGSDRSLEAAAIGRRVAEIEYDLLELID